MNRLRVPVVAFAFAAGLATLGVACKGGGAAEPQKNLPSTAKVHVTTTPAAMAPMPRFLPLTGSLRGEDQSDLAAGTAGRLLKVNMERGSDVKKGDVIALVDTRQAQLSAAEARSSADLAKEQVASAKRDCERYKTLLDKGSISRAEYDRYADQCRNTELQAQTAGLRAAQAGQTVSDGVIRAPFAGVVADRFIDVGEYVQPSTKVATLVSLDPLRVEFAVPEVRMGLVKKGAEVHFTVLSQPGRTFSGTVRYLGASVRESTRDLVVEAVVHNTDRALAPGMFAEVQLELGEEPVPVVPKEALVPRDGLSFLFVVEDGRAIERVVATGATRDGKVAILKGVKDGDKIVVSPPPALSNGTPVEL